MTVNDDFANRELSIEELEAIAAGGWFTRIVHRVEHAAEAVVNFLEHIPVKVFLPTPTSGGPIDALRRMD